jgi:type II secretory pathway component GspD/PulD (secretin)
MSSKLAVSALGLTLAGVATLAYVELSVGGEADAGSVPASPAASSAPARPAPVRIVKPVEASESQPAAEPTREQPRTEVRSTARPAEVRPAEVRPAGPRLPEAGLAAGLKRYEIAARLSQAEAAVFHGRFQTARTLLAELEKPETRLREEERALLEKIRSQMDLAGKAAERLPAQEFVAAPAADAAPVFAAAPADQGAPAAPAPAPADPAAPAPAPAPGEPASPAPGADGLLDQAALLDRIIREQTQAEFRRRYDAAKEQLDKQSFDQAERLVDSAIQVVNSNALYLENRGADLIAQAESLRATIRNAKAAELERRKLQQEEEAKRLDVVRRNTEMEQRNLRIRTFLKNAEDALREGDPARALELYDLVLKIDPGNVAANARKEVVSDMYDHLVIRGVDRTRARQEMFQNIDLMEGRIPWYHEVRLPADWDELSRRRLERLSEDDDPQATRDRERLDRNARRLLNTIKPQLNLPGIPLNQAVDFIRELWGANIFVNFQALADAGVDTEQLITLNLKDVSLRTALDTIFEIAGGKLEPNLRPSFIVDGGIIIVSTAELLATRTATVVYDISDLVLVERVPSDPQRVQLTQFAQGSGVFTGGAQGGGGGGAGGGLFGGAGGQQDFTAEQEEAVRARLVEDITNLVKTVDPATFAADPMNPGDAPGAVREFLGSLVVRQTRANHDKIRKLLADLRSVSQKQVSIEVRFVQIDSAVLEQILFDFDIDVTGAFSEDRRAQGTFLNIVNNGISGSGLGTATGEPPFVSGLPTLGGPHPVDLLTFNPQTGRATEFGNSQAKISGNSTGLLVNGAIIDDIAVRFFLQATQASNRTGLYTAPKVTVLNGRKATIAVRTFRPYVANVKTNVGGGTGVGVDPIVQLAESGTTMWVRPVISHDNRFVTMQLNPVLTNTNLSQIPEFQVTGSGTTMGGMGMMGGMMANFPPPAITIQQPIRFEQNIFTTVKVPDKGTVVLGGFKTSIEVERELGVPILSKIPVVKRLFANRSYGRDDSVLIILVRPTIHLYEEIDPFFEVRPGQRVAPPPGAP